MTSPYRIIGIESSPYAAKVRAVMRYRRLPYIWVARMPQFFAETAEVRPLIMPVVQFPEGDYRTDSTPIILDLEQRHPAQRSIVPTDPAQAFLSELLEDMADEWLTKCLFHYRFSDPAAARSGARWVIDDAHPGLGSDELERLTAAFIARQQARMPLVGCTAANAPVIEAFFTSLLNVLEPFVATERYLFGSRPALADFGIYAQLRTLARDPLSMALMRAQAPRTDLWVQRLDDASGVDGTWDADLSATVQQLLALAATWYLPYLRANEAARDGGEATLSITLDGRPFQQAVFRYHAKCYSTLKHRYASLPDATRKSLAPLLERTGCLKFLD